MPEFDFASQVEQREPYYIVLKRVRDEQGNIIEEDKVALPLVLPADLMLQFFNKDRKEVEKMQSSPRDQLQVGLDVIERLIGKEEWERVLHTIGFDNINPLLTDIFKYYGLGPGDDEDAGKETPEEKVDPSPSTPSLTTLEQSTPISNGSTPTPGVDSTEDASTGDTFSPASPIYPPSPSL